MLGTGLIVVLTAPIQTPDQRGWIAVAVVTAVMTAAVALSALLPWRRWPDQAVLAFPAVTLLGVTALSVYGNGLGAAYIGVYVLAFVYVGLFTPARTVWLLLPLAVACYGPTAGGWSAAILVRLVVVALVWVVVAELLAHLSTRQRETVRALNLTSRTDALTHLDNRRALDEHLTKAPVGTIVVLCDLDHFKAVNDTHGHDYGDRVLADFAGLLSADLRSDDRAARYGGEEFLLLLRASAGAVPEVLARLHVQWALARPGITFSTGWAVHTGQRAIQDTVAAADRALYRAKHAGRDRDVGEHVPTSDAIDSSVQQHAAASSPPSAVPQSTAVLS